MFTAHEILDLAVQLEENGDSCLSRSCRAGVKSRYQGFAIVDGR